MRIQTREQKYFLEERKVLLHPVAETALIVAFPSILGSVCELELSFVPSFGICFEKIWLLFLFLLLHPFGSLFGLVTPENTEKSSRGWEKWEEERGWKKRRKDGCWSQKERIFKNRTTLLSFASRYFCFKKKRFSSSFLTHLEWEKEGMFCMSTSHENEEKGEKREEECRERRSVRAKSTIHKTWVGYSMKLTFWKAYSSAWLFYKLNTFADSPTNVNRTLKRFVTMNWMRNLFRSCYPHLGFKGSCRDRDSQRVKG